MSFNYDELYERIIKNEDISSKKKAALIRMLKFYTSFKSLQDAKEKEDKTYTVYNNVISDKDRIDLELYKIEDMYKKHEFLEDKIDKYIDLKKEYSYLSDKMDEESYQKLKEDLTEIQIENDINPKFYSTYGNILKKYAKEEEEKRTL